MCYFSGFDGARFENLKADARNALDSLCHALDAVESWCVTNKKNGTHREMIDYFQNYIWNNEEGKSCDDSYLFRSYRKRFDDIIFLCKGSGEVEKEIKAEFVGLSFCFLVSQIQEEEKNLYSLINIMDEIGNLD